MRTSIEIPPLLLEEAKLLMNAKTKTQALIIALTEAIARRKSRRVLSLEGTMTSDYDYKKSRRRR